MEFPDSVAGKPEDLKTLDKSILSKAHGHKPNSDEEEFVKHLTMGIEDTLHAHPMIKDVKLIVRPPINSFLLTSWERRYGLRLPSDLLAFYGSTNGFRLNWDLIYADEFLKIGNICINPIQELLPLDMNFEAKEPEIDGIPSKSRIVLKLSDIQISQKLIPDSFHKMKLGKTVKAFQIDNSQPDVCTICLVYLQPEKRLSEADHTARSPHLPPESLEPETQIWFLDRSFQWHFLAPTFTIFYRMALFHLGLLEWPYRFTSFGISPWIEQIFWLVAPNLIQSIQDMDTPNMDPGIWSNSKHIPEEASTPNKTPNMLSLSMFKKKKKEHHQRHNKTQIKELSN